MTTAPLRVLVVDDSEDTAKMMKVLLKREGYEAKTAFDGPEAIETAREFKPDAMLLDLTLPGMGGTEVAKELKGTPDLRECVFVAISGYDAEPLDSPSPFERHFKKPVDHTALVSFLKGALRKPEADDDPA